MILATALENFFILHTSRSEMPKRLLLKHAALVRGHTAQVGTLGLFTKDQKYMLGLTARYDERSGTQWACHHAPVPYTCKPLYEDWDCVSAIGLPRCFHASALPFQLLKIADDSMRRSAAAN